MIVWKLTVPPAGQPCPATPAIYDFVTPCASQRQSATVASDCKGFVTTNPATHCDSQCHVMTLCA